MENKYYIPNIEEFHIGFEYEGLERDGSFSKRIYGKEKIFNNYIDNFSNLELYINTNQIRVKYLDKEDIESLGFKLIINSIADNYLFQLNLEDNKLVHLIYYKKAKLIFISKGDNESQYCDWKTLYNKGFIKNKSKLKELLKDQLRLINE